MQGLRNNVVFTAPSGTELTCSAPVQYERDLTSVSSGCDNRFCISPLTVWMFSKCTKDDLIFLGSGPEV